MFFNLFKKNTTKGNHVDCEKSKFLEEDVLQLEELLKDGNKLYLSVENYSLLSLDPEICNIILKHYRKKLKKRL